MDPKVDKQTIEKATAAITSAKEQWYGKYTAEGIDKSKLSENDQSALGQNVKDVQRLSALLRTISSGKSTDAQRKEFQELTQKLDGANSSQASAFEAAKKSKGVSTSTTGTTASSTTKEPEDANLIDGVDPKDIYCQIGPPQDGQGALPPDEQQANQFAESFAKMRASKKPELAQAADELEAALKGGNPDRAKSAQACLSIYMRSGECEEFSLAMSGFRASGIAPAPGTAGITRVDAGKIKSATDEMDTQLSKAIVPEDPALKPALDTLGLKIKESIEALNKLDPVKDKAKYESAQIKLQESLDIYVNLKDYESRNRQQHVRDAYDNMNRARAILGLTEIKLTMESRVNREISGNELQINRNTADGNIEAGRADAGNMSLKGFTAAAESGDLSLNQAAGGSKTLKEYARNSADTERALLERDRARSERQLNGQRTRRDSVRLNRETLSEANGAVREAHNIIDQAKKDPLAAIGAGALILQALKGSNKPTRGW